MNGVDNDTWRIDYTRDNNGNLLSDGVNTYTYDSANRLTGYEGPSINAAFSYNGLGDRVQQTVNGQPINYTLDLNSGLTQVLNDGTDTYLYGLDRIAQVNGANTDYFLGDALNSVRQLTDAGGAITLAEAYDPYGVTAQTGGTSQTSYGFTGEQMDPTGMVYLRARYYAPGQGRFTTRDTWEGDTNQPMSYNMWNYVQSNPVNYADSTGQDRCLSSDFTARTDFAEKYVDRTIEGHLIRDYLNTYTAGGIGVQCYGTDIPNPLKPWDYNNSGFGPGQISNNQVWTPYGQEVGNDRGYGLRCYITQGYDCACLDSKNIPQGYQLEPVHNQSDKTWAIVYMRRRIKLVTDVCEEKGCSSTDVFIAAALAQNGPGFTKQNIHDLTLPRLRKYENDVTINWKDYFGLPNNADDTSHQLTLFTGVVRELEKRGWYLPYVNWNTVDELSRIGD